ANNWIVDGASGLFDGAQRDLTHAMMAEGNRSTWSRTLSAAGLARLAVWSKGSRLVGGMLSEAELPSSRAQVTALRS
ncbi:MAG: hypothetical protein ABW292_08440, partial [Vicinamibacterales bacterium]